MTQVQKCSKEYVLFPERMNRKNPDIMIIVPPHFPGNDCQKYLRLRAFNLPGYNKKIQCTAEGINERGERISVKTIGDYVFGVPGYSGNIQCWTKGFVICIGYPRTTPRLMKEFLLTLKWSIEEC